MDREATEGEIFRQHLARIAVVVNDDDGRCEASRVQPRHQ
jgi:hypothetical protein